jgi:hypothetical protein
MRNMALDVAAARAAVGQAALARDEDALRAIADSLPALAAFGYERHRARAFANAIRGAHDSAVAELCLGVAACAPAASTFVADSAQLRLLGGKPVQVADRARTGPSARAALSAAALAAAVAALALLPARTLDDAPREAAGITAPPRSAPPRVVVADPPAASPVAPTPPAPRSATPDAGTATLVRAVVGGPTRAEQRPRPAAVTRVARPRPAAPAPPSPPATEPAPAPAPPPPTAAPAAAIAPAVVLTRGQPRGKALGHVHAPGRLEKTVVAAAPATQPEPPAPAADVVPEHPGQGQGRGQDHGRGP